ncbi:MAG TPA: gamma-glutamyltransferase [Gammaproteobacteria bacterium]|nr:gamma-glutamyltransferase [Gammaproteobacteria bacterium]
MKIRLIAVSLLIVTLPAFAAGPKPPQAAVASAHPLATRAGMEVLAQGGNAVDAAIAVSAALSVVEPYSSGIGGGGLWLLHRDSDGADTMVDGREYAPGTASADMYQDKSGNVIPGASTEGPLSAAIPGAPAAWVYMAKRYGHLTLAQDLAPAIKLARDGFPLDSRFHEMIAAKQDLLKRWPGAAAVFLDKGEVPAVGWVLKQPDLADTFDLVAKDGDAGFYAGKRAQQMVDAVRAAGGIWTLDDLKQYKVVERKPLTGDYLGMHIVSAPPPSSGGVVLIEILNILAGYDLAHMDAVTQKHLVIEAMRYAYHDRADYLGDPDFVQMPIERLINTYYAAGLRATILMDKATPSSSLTPISMPQLGNNTTHYSVLDKDGNRVSATVTVNFRFGSGFMAPGTGVTLNDEMDDFSSKPGVPNGYGLVGNSANAIGPHKRPLSSMTPTFLEKKDGIAILGTPGGSRIISMMLLGALDFFKGGDAQSIVSLPRYHQQYLPDMVGYEDGALTDAEVTALQKMGYALKDQGRWGNMQAITWDYKAGKVSAASDPRGIGTAEVH